MKKLSNFLVKFRIPVFPAMIAFVALCAFLIPHVNINKDMTKYLSESSPMKQGIDLMDKEFPDNEDEHYVRLLLSDVPDNEKLKIKNEIKDMEYVESVSYDKDDEDYNKDSYTLYEVATLFDYDTDEEAQLEKQLEERYKNYSPVVENLSNDVVLAPYLYISVIAVLLAIMFIMSASWFEPVLILSVIGISIVVNMGSNFFLPSVSNTTFAIAAILQLVLSLDYSVILMNRYRQERVVTDDKVSAMKTALADAFPSIVSSALTTFVGLLMLIFMRYKIGADLGIVLAKGVAASLLCIFTMLPFLIILTDKILEKTKKPSPKIPMGGLAGLSKKLRFALPAIFAGLFIVFFLLQRLTPISFDGTPDRAIAKIFPEDNRFVVLYNNKDASALPTLQEKIEELDGVSSTASFESTLDKKRTPEDMIDFLEDMDVDVDMQAEELKLIYYDYFKNGEAPSIGISELAHFINDDILPKERYAERMNDETKENIPAMVKFTDKAALTSPRTYMQMSDFLKEQADDGEEMSPEDMQLMYVYYFADRDDYTPASMTINDFVRFVQDDVSKDETIAEYNDNNDFSEIDRLTDFVDAGSLTQQRDASGIANTLEMDYSQADQLLTLYYGLPAADSYNMTINELLDYLINDVSANPDYASLFNGDTLSQLSQASALANVAATGQSLTFTQMAQSLGMDESQTAGIYMLYASSSSPELQAMATATGTPEAALTPEMQAQIAGSVSMTIPEFIDFVSANVLTNPQYAASINSASAAALTGSSRLINAAAMQTPLNYASAASLLDMNADSMYTLYAMRAGELTSPRTASMIDLTDFILTQIAPDPTLGSTFADEDMANLNRLSNIMHSAYEGRQLTFTEMAELLEYEDASDMKMLYTLKEARENADFGRMSVNEFITHLTTKILPDENFRERISDERKKDLNSLAVLTNAVMSDKKYNPDELTRLFGEFSDQVNPDDMYLVSMLYGSAKDYDPAWRMSILDMFDFISENVMKDSRFDSAINEEDRAQIMDNKQDLFDAVDKLKGDNYSILMVNTKLPFESKETDIFLDKLYELLDTSLKNEDYRIGNSVMYREMQGSFGSEMLLITILTAGTIFAIVAITFKNLVIPAILVLIVLCGVFITVAVSGLRGVSINYLANIIVQCILMGACIDYGILFTSYYRDNRKQKDIKGSLKAAYDGSIHTVLTSGLIMVLVTGIIGFISTDPSVGPICLTLSIGSASAILLILFILPGMLAAFDKIVVSRKKKKP